MVNLPAKTNVPEIQIFSITLKTLELNKDVLRCIDQAIPLPIFYKLTFEDRFKAKAAYKLPGDADAGKWMVDKYFEIDWLPSDTGRAELPVAMNLAGLYK